jgi:hypothetical protein
MNSEENNEYSLTFSKAVEACLDGKGFIRGKDFRPGYYAKSSNNVLVLMNGKETFHIAEGNLPITKGMLSQKYKLFIVVNQKELEIAGDVQSTTPD